MAPWKSESSQVSRLWVYYTNLIIDHHEYESGHTTQTQTGTPDFFSFFFLMVVYPEPDPKSDSEKQRSF